MKRLFFTLFLLTFITSTYSQKETIEHDIKATISIFFEGLQNGDTLRIKEAIRQDLKLQTTYVNENGESVLRTQSKKAFFQAIANKNPAAVWKEMILSYDIKIDGNLASVWTPYEFYLDGAFSHCGTNSFQLFDNNGIWQIIFIVDTRKKKGCK